VDFKNTVVIMTSNIGSQFLLEGVTSDGEISDKARNAVMGEMRKHFRPEFLNRVDATVLFRPLKLEEIERIVDILLVDLRKRLADRKIDVQLSERARAFVAQEGFDPVYGARPLRRFLQQQVETRLGRAIISGDVEDGSTVVIDEVDGSLSIRTKGGESEEVGTRKGKTRH
jgi:ATP-dependent Clp protease ATP-binding subunit ClpB